MNGALPSPAGAVGSLSPGHNRLLILAATAMELDPIQTALAGSSAAASLEFLVCGVGPVACAATLAARLAAPPTSYTGVVLSGVGGLYPQASDPSGASPHLLAVCLAEREILADFGIAAPHGATPFNSPDFAACREFTLHSPLAAKAAALLNQMAIPFQTGVFLTVNAATATLERSRALRDYHRGLCENMEGAAAALVCQRFDLPLLEIRTISNLVEDRDPGRWRLAEAIKRQAEVLTRLLPQLISAPLSEDCNCPAHARGNCSAVPQVGASGPAPRTVGYASRADRPKMGCCWTVNEDLA